MIFTKAFLLFLLVGVACGVTYSNNNRRRYFRWPFLRARGFRRFDTANVPAANNIQEAGNQQGSNGTDTGDTVIIPPAKLWPTPNGPFYGFPFSTNATIENMLPFTVSGTCQAGKTYQIKKAEDILNYQTELECLYSTGIVPVKVPEGALYGTIISILNTRLFNQMVGQYWQGSYINKTTCNEKTAYIGWNNFMGTPSVPFSAFIGNPPVNLAPGEHDDGRSAIVQEFGIDLAQGCPEYRENLTETMGRSAVRTAVLSATTPPWNQMVNAFRYIGKQEDGGDIYLGKTYMKDPFRDDQQAATVAYFIFINYDNNANPLNLVGLPVSLPLPSTQSFKYIHPGIMDLFFRLSPIDNLFTNPAGTIKRMTRAWTNILLLFQSLPFGLRNIRRNAHDFRARFYHDLRLRTKIAEADKQKPNPTNREPPRGRDDLLSSSEEGTTYPSVPSNSVSSTQSTTTTTTLKTTTTIASKGTTPSVTTTTRASTSAPLKPKDNN